MGGGDEHLVRSPTGGIGGPFFYRIKSFPRNADYVYDHDDCPTFSVFEGESPNVERVVCGFGGLWKKGAAQDQWPLLRGDVHDGGARSQSVVGGEGGGNKSQREDQETR